MQQCPLISVVLTSYNQKEQLSRAFESLIGQTYKNLEIIIVDDCSTDGVSQPFIRSLAKKYPSSVRYFFQEKNVGIAKNKNTGFKLASGLYITYLDGDDYYLPSKLRQEVDIFLSHPEVDVVYSNFLYQDYEGNSQGTWCEANQTPPQGNIFEEVITRSFPKNTLFRFELMKAEVLRSINYYDEEISAFHDWDSRIRYSKLYNIKYAAAVGSVYVQDPAGISKTKSQLYLLREMNLVFEKNKSLLSDLPEDRKRLVERILQEKLLKGQVIHSDSRAEFWKSTLYYLLMKPADLRFLLSQMYSRAKQMLVR